MTTTEINVAIAELCGWKHCHTTDAKEWQHPQMTGPCFNQSQLPNYATDLNAMHEAEKTIPKEIRFRYRLQLGAVTLGHPLASLFNEPGLMADERIFCATALQRAEAFLRAHKKWKE